MSFLIFHGSLQLLTSSHLRERDKMLLRAILCGGFGTDFFLARSRRKTFLVVFVERGMVMVTYSGSVLSSPPLLSPFQHVWDLPEFAYLMSLDRSKWP